MNEYLIIEIHYQTMSKAKNRENGRISNKEEEARAN